MKPNELAARLTQIIAETCKCEASWAQHPQAMTAAELDVVYHGIEKLMEKEFIKAFEREIDAREHIAAWLRGADETIDK